MKETLCYRCNLPIEDNQDRYGSKAHEKKAHTGCVHFMELNAITGYTPNDEWYSSKFKTALAASEA